MWVEWSRQRASSNILGGPRVVTRRGPVGRTKDSDEEQSGTVGVGGGLGLAGPLLWRDFAL